MTLALSGVSFPAGGGNKKRNSPRTRHVILIKVKVCRGIRILYAGRKLLHPHPHLPPSPEKRAEIAPLASASFSQGSAALGRGSRAVN